MARTFWGKVDDFCRQIEQKSVPIEAFFPRSQYVGGEKKAVKDLGDGSIAIKEGYKACTWVWACVRRKQNMISSLRWMVRQYFDDGSWTDDHKHPAAMAINFPRSPGGIYYMMYRNTGFLSVVGNAFFSKLGLYNDDEEVKKWLEGKARRLMSLSPVGLTPIKDGVGWIKHYEKQDKSELKKEAVIHVMIPSLTEPTWGQSELLGIATPIDIDVSADSWNLSSFGSGGMPTTIIVDYTQTADTLPKARAEMEERFRARGRDRMPWLIPGAGIEHGGIEGLKSAFELHKLGMTPEEIDYVAGAGLTRDKIFVGMGFHPADASNERATHDNKEAADKQAWEQAAMPLIMAFSSFFTEDLLTQEEQEDGMVVMPNFKPIRALAESTEKLAEAFGKLTNGGMSVTDGANAAGIEISDLPEYAVPIVPGKAISRLQAAGMIKPQDPKPSGGNQNA